MKNSTLLLVNGAMSVFFALATMGCGGDSKGATPKDTPDGGASGGNTGAGGASSGSGGAASVAGAKGSGGAQQAAGGASPGGAANSSWVDSSPPSANGDCSGVVVNRLTGQVLTDVTNGGIWKSTNQGGDWVRVDDGVVGGLVVLGPGFDVDQDDPTRVAAWSLDGTGGWTTDGTTWNTMATIGRNWDFGATDWATPTPKTMMVTRHESGGEVYLSTDGAATWTLMSIKVFASMGTVPPPEFAMVGVMDASTLIYSDGAGIFRSTNMGTSFMKVSDLKPRTRIPVLFRGVFYLGGDGLMISKDKGATWQPQGSNLQMWVGPYFGADENSMMVANSDGVYLTSDAGENWTKVAAIPTDSKYDPRVWGGYAWDPVGQILYTAAVGKPLLKLKL